MYAKKQEKHPDAGTDSFKDFSASLKLQTRNLTKSFKHLQTKKLKTTQSLQSKTILSGNVNADQISHKNIEDVPNKKYHADTWDSRHLDTFLQDNQWAYTPAPTRQALTSQKTMRSGSTYNLANIPRVGTASTTASKQSFFFNTVSRFKEDNNYKQRDYGNQYSSHNFMVYERPTDAENATKYFDHQFTERPKNFDFKRLEFSQQEVRLNSPEQKRREIQETKQEIQKFKQWKEEHKNLTKKLRVHKAGYKSGILQVDNPYNFDTGLYKEESDVIKKRLVHSREINERFKKDLENRTKTNHNIEFFNTETRRKAGRQTYDPKHDKLNPLWNNKSRVDCEMVRSQSQSQTRLFGGPIEGKYSVTRAMNLQKNDHKGRDYNFLSYTKSHLDGFQKPMHAKNKTQVDINSS